MTQNRCRLFRAVMATLPDTKEQKHFDMPWYNDREMTKHSTKNLMKETTIRSPKLHKMKQITEEEPEILEYIERMTL